MGTRSRFVRALLTAMMVLVMAAVPARAHGGGEEEELGVDLQVSSVSRVPKTGELLVRGSITCEEAAEAWLWASAQQSVGRFGMVEGEGYKEEVSCGPQAKSYSLTISAYTGRHFQGGKVNLYIYADACGPETCGYDYHEMTARVKALRR